MHLDLYKSLGIPELGGYLIHTIYMKRLTGGSSLLYNKPIILYRKIIVEQRKLFSFFYYHVRMAGLSAMLTLIVKEKN